MSKVIDASRKRLFGRVADPVPGYAELTKTQWCLEFEKLCRNRLVMGAFRYGRVGEQDYSKYDLVAEIHKRAARYKDTRNLEHLVDAANICMLAFVHGQRNGETLRAVDDGEHTLEI